MLLRITEPSRRWALRLGILPTLAACAAEAPAVAPGGDTADTPHSTGFDREEIVLADVDLTTGGGLGVADLTGDGRMDLVLPVFGHDVLLVGGPDRTWTDETLARWSTPDVISGEAASLADYDGDADLDLFVTAIGHNQLFRNDDGVLAEVEGLAGYGYLSEGAVWQDVDGDEDLDVYVINHSQKTLEPSAGQTPGDPDELYENVDGSFVDRSDTLPDTVRDGFGYAAAFMDLTGDGRSDVYVANDFGPQSYANALAAGDGAWGWATPDCGLDVSTYSMGLAVGDLNDDTEPDLLVSSWETLPLLLSDGGGDWYDASAARGLVPNTAAGQHVAWSGLLGDVDNDGDLDVAVNFGALPATEGATLSGLPNPEAQPDGIFLQDDDGTFSEVGAAWGFDDPDRGRGLVLADLDHDGALDLVRRSPVDGLSLFWGRPDGDHWAELSLLQDGPNPLGVGAKLVVEAGDRRMTRWILASGAGAFSAGPPEAHVGLGSAAVIDRITVTWPDGGETVYTGVAVDERTVLVR